MKTTNWLIAGIDTGGTFTDLISLSENELKVIKIPSTPSDPKLAVINAVKRLGFITEILHGTTVATNAILERKGAKTALITTKGFKDVIEIGRQNRNDIYALYPTRTKPLVDHMYRYEVDERITADGTIYKNLNDREIEEIISKILDQKIESVAVCTLFSYLKPSHEKRIGELINNKLPYSLSHIVFPEYREYERISTTVIDAYIKPLVSSYLNSLEENLIGTYTNHFAVMKSSKGLARGKTISKKPVETIFSGLAGGIQAAEFTSRLLDVKNLISIDIGGTSTDVASVVNGKVSLQQSQKIDGLPVSSPSVDVITIGAGGGSLIQYKSGLIRVGPDSAGADPGPIAYDKGGSTPTVTDADLSYGVLGIELAGGELIMKPELSNKGMKEFSEKIGLSFEETVIGARLIFHENIAAALRSVSQERGLDPRDFVLLAFGGAGPVHACELAEIMGINQVIIPPLPGAWSAVGLIGGDYIYNQSQGIVKLLSELTIENLNEEYDELQEKVINLVKEDGHVKENVIEKFVSLRYKGQSYELIIPFKNSTDQIARDFKELHKERYGFAAENEPLEIVAIQIYITIPHKDPVLPEISKISEEKIKEYRKVINFREKVPVYTKNALGYEFQKNGPLIIDQLDTTTWIPKNWEVKLNKSGFMIISKI